MEGAPHIALLEGLWADPRTGQFFIITEYCAGGELCVSDCPFDEIQVAGLMVQLVEALAAMNANHIAHRDLKPQNLMLKRPGDLSSLVVIDFGVARSFRQSERLRTHVGTPEFAGPEVFHQGPFGYDEACDVWSLGALAYLMLTGNEPFTGTSRQVYSTQKAGVEYPENLSPEAVDLCTALLVLDAEQRPKPSTVLEHPFLAKAERAAPLSSGGGAEAAAAAGTTASPSPPPPPPEPVITADDVVALICVFADGKARRTEAQIIDFVLSGSPPKTMLGSGYKISTRDAVRMLLPALHRDHILHRDRDGGYVFIPGSVEIEQQGLAFSAPKVIASIAKKKAEAVAEAEAAEAAASAEYAIEDLQGMSVGALKKLMRANVITMAGCVEKADMVAAVVQSGQVPIIASEKPPPPPPPPAEEAEFSGNPFDGEADAGPDARTNSFTGKGWRGSVLK